MALRDLIAVALLAVVFTSSARGAAADWPMLRHDTRLTGRSPAKGDIRQPRILDTLFAGAYEGLAVVRPAAGAADFSAETELPTDYLAAHGQEWDLEGLLGRVEDGASNQPTNPQVRWAKLLPDAPGLQKIEFQDAFSGEPTQVGRLYAFDQSSDEPRTVWQTEPEKDMYLPTILVVDADADGLPEVVVATHYRVMIYDGRTGAKKTELRWHGMRNYGYFGCFTVPGERYPKFVVISDFVSHIDVLDNDGKQLKVLWRKDIEPTIIRKQKITRPGPNPIADVDGDGRHEIILNLYNDTGDHRWHVIAFDAVTGDVRHDLAGAYLNGLADLDGDGTPELFLQQTRGLAVPFFSTIRLVSLKGGREDVLWSHTKGRWQTALLKHLPLTANTGAADGTRTVLLSRGKQGIQLYAVAAADKGRREKLMVISRGADGRWASAAEVTGPAGAHLQAKAVDATGGGAVLLSWRASDPKACGFEARHATGEVVSWRRSGGPTPVPIVARLRPSEPPTVILQNGSEEIIAYQRKSGEWIRRWKRPGRGMTNSAPGYQGVVAADVDGDGACEVVFARPSSSGEAQLVAVDPDGREKWSKTFPGFDGAAPMWNLGGLTLWTVGSFTSRDHPDILVHLRRSTMHSDEGRLLSGKDGRLLWQRDAVVVPGDRNAENWRGYGGTLLAAADVDGDSLDEIISCYPDRYWVASGKTGEVEKIADTAGGVFPGMWVAYGTPIVADFLNRSNDQVLWGGSGYLTALLNTDGKPLWYGEYKDGTSALQGVGNVEGSGKLFIGGAGYKDGFRCFDPTDGAPEWTYPLPQGGTSGPTITADVDGDGVEEFVFTHGRTIYALNGRDGKSNLVWSLELPADPGPLAYADADGDGRPEILFGGNDGNVYVVGDSESRKRDGA